MLGKELEQSLNTAFRRAFEKRHEFITVEHLLLAMTENVTAANVLRACACNIDLLKTELDTFLDETTPLIAPGVKKDTQPTLGFQRVMQRAAFHVQSSGRQEVTGANILVALFGEQDSHAVYLLNKQEITRLDVVNYISHGVSRIQESDESAPHKANSGQEDAENAGAVNPLEKFAADLNDLARKGEIDPLIGRRGEIERTIQVLCRRRKNNPLLVGEAGVGKTAIAEGLAKKIVEGDVPEVLRDSIIYSLDLGSLVAGTKYRGDFEKRLKSLLAQIKKQKNAILFIDEIHTIIGAGSASGGVMDASNLIKPMLASGALRCIGSTTYQEYRGIFEKDRALARRFQKIDIHEPNVEETYQILKGLKSRFEQHHDVKYSLAALKTAAELADRYINDRFLPDKAIDVIDEAGASQRLLPASRRKKMLGTQDIEDVVARIARIPAKTISIHDKDKLKNLEKNLGLLVFGQNEAISALASAIKLARAGLRELQKPIGSFLFSGPTGVGKTEVCRQLASAMGIELIRFDMSEYMERHTVSRLIGAPPGYVGYDQGGLLTDAVNKAPHAVLLLDEIEKAHPDVFNLLLQVMDHGTLTDNNGRKADFRNIVLIMTTNAGASEADRSSIGFTQQDHSTDGMKAIERLFSPEFRNRLDAIIPFKSLDLSVIRQVVDKFMFELETQLAEKHVSLALEPEAREWLAKHGCDPRMGARPMARVIQENIKKPLAEELLFGKLAHGGTVRIGVEDEHLSFDIAGTQHKEKTLEAELH